LQQMEVLVLHTPNLMMKPVSSTLLSASSTSQQLNNGYPIVLTWLATKICANQLCK
jgi:hypothetical protein